MKSFVGVSTQNFENENFLEKDALREFGLNFFGLEMCYVSKISLIGV